MLVMLYQNHLLVMCYGEDGNVGVDVHAVIIRDFDPIRQTNMLGREAHPGHSIMDRLAAKHLPGLHQFDQPPPVKRPRPVVRRPPRKPSSPGCRERRARCTSASCLSRTVSVSSSTF